jgi:chromosome partitioning protein
MTVFSLYNLKGGVGKTATVVNLSYLAALESAKTLVFDLDPQASATYYFRIKARVKSGKKALVKGGSLLEKQIKGTDYDFLDLLPADLSYRNLDLVFNNAKRSKNKLKDNLKSLQDEYEYIFLDCPPNITLVSENVFNVSDYILVPIIPTTLSYRTYRILLKFFENRSLSTKIIIPFFSMVEMRKNLHKEMMEKMHKKYKGILQSKISYSSLIERMGIYRQPVVNYKPKSIVTDQYHALWREIKEKIYSQ